MKERIIRMELTDLEKILREQGTIKKNEYLNGMHPVRTGLGNKI